MATESDIKGLVDALDTMSAANSGPSVRAGIRRFAQALEDYATASDDATLLNLSVAFAATWVPLRESLLGKSDAEEDKKIWS